MKKPKIQDYYDETDPRGISSSEYDDYLKDLIKWEREEKEKQKICKIIKM